MEPARLSPGTRTALRLGGLALVALGLAVAVFGVLRMSGSLGASDFEATRRAGLAGFGMAAGGMVLVFVGVVLTKFGFLRPVAEIVATERGTVVEYSAQRAGRGWGAGRQGGIRVRCKACGFLDSEDARFCSGCGQAM